MDVQQVFMLDPGEWNWVERIVFYSTYPLWVASYVLMILRAHRDKHYALPLVAAAVMFGFEFCFLFIWPVHKRLPDFHFWIYFEVIWMAMDGWLLVQCALYGKNSLPGSALAKRPWLTVIGVTTIATIGTAAFVQWTGMKDAVVPAIMAVALIACQFPAWLADRQQHVGVRHGPDGISYWAIVLRSLGDLSTVITVLVVFTFVGAGSRPTGVAPIPLWGQEAGIQSAEPGQPPVPDVGVGQIEDLDLSFQLLSPPYGVDDVFLWVGPKGTHYALAPISPANPWTLFLLFGMLACDAWVVWILTRQRAHDIRRPAVVIISADEGLRA